MRKANPPSLWMRLQTVAVPLKNRWRKNPVGNSQEAENNSATRPSYAALGHVPKGFNTLPRGSLLNQVQFCSILMVRKWKPCKNGSTFPLRMLRSAPRSWTGAKHSLLQGLSPRAIKVVLLGTVFGDSERWFNCDVVCVCTPTLLRQ